MSKTKISTAEHWITTDSGRLFARSWQPTTSNDHGSKAPIVLLHDSLGCVALWRSFPALLAEHTGRQVIAYDRLGFGQSDPRTDTLSMGFVLQEAVAFFPALQGYFGFERFAAMGHSVGGGMAVYCAAHYAASCEALITESAQTFVEDKTLAGIIEAQEQFRQAEPVERLRRYHGDKTRWVLNAWIDTWLSPAFAAWSLHDVLPQVKCPTLTLHGDEDEYGSNRHPEQIACMVGGPAQLEIMPGVRHVPHREQEDWVVSRVSQFLSTSIS